MPETRPVCKKNRQFFGGWFQSRDNKDSGPAEFGTPPVAEEVLHGGGAARSDTFFIGMSYSGKKRADLQFPEREGEGGEGSYLPTTYSVGGGKESFPHRERPVRISASKKGWCCTLLPVSTAEFCLFNICSPELKDHWSLEICSFMQWFKLHVLEHFAPNAHCVPVRETYLLPARLVPEWTNGTRTLLFVPGNSTLAWNHPSSLSLSLAATHFSNVCLYSGGRRKEGRKRRNPERKQPKGWGRGNFAHGSSTTNSMCPAKN